MRHRWARAGGAAGLAALLVGCSASVLPTVTVTVTVTPSSAASATPDDWTAVVERARGALYRIQTTSCTSGKDGLVATGFAIGEHLVLTAAHVVEYQQEFELSSERGSGGAHVLGFDAQADVALLWLDASADSTLSLTESPPKQSDPVLLLGFPGGVQDVQQTTGTVTGVDGTGTVTDAGGIVQREGMLVTDIATDTGNSGGPLLATDGQVVGVASAHALEYSTGEGRVSPSAGSTYAVQPGQFADQLEQWRTSTSVVNTCDPDSVNHVIKNLDTSPDGAADALAALDSFWLSVNAGDFATAWAKLNTRGQQVKGSYDRWSTKMTGAQYSDGYLESARASTASASATVVVNLTESTTAGETRCRVWRLTYGLTSEAGQWLVGPYGGRSIGRC